MAVSTSAWWVSGKMLDAEPMARAVEGWESRELGDREPNPNPSSPRHLLSGIKAFFCFTYTYNA